MKVKTSELTGAALNWVVASIEWPNDSGIRNPKLMSKESVNEEYPFDVDWSLTGPIIEREWLHPEPWPNSSNIDSRWSCTQYDLHTPVGCLGSTLLIAAMRCFIASKLGDEVEVPEHLI